MRHRTGRQHRGVKVNKEQTGEGENRETKQLTQNLKEISEDWYRLAVFC